MITLSVPQLSGNELKYVTECIQSGWISSAGSYVNRFEESFARKLGSAHAVACSSGTAALHISLLLAGVKPNDEVIVPTVTFIAPINTVRYVGAHPVFMDCDEYLNIDVEKVERFLKEECCFVENRLVNKTTGRAVTAIIPVHIFGHPVDMERIMVLATEFNIKVIEDATESLGSYYVDGKYRGKKTGTIGHFGCFSFNGNKIITTGGGGMIVTDDADLAKYAGYLTTQAKDDAVCFMHDEVGYNYRLTNVQAAIGLAQLEQLDNFLTIKRNNFQAYCEQIGKVTDCTLIQEPAGTQSNYWHYCLLLPEENVEGSKVFVKMLEKRGVQTRPLWYLNHLQKPYGNCSQYQIQKAPNYHRRVVNIPCSVGLTSLELTQVVAAIDECCRIGTR